MKFDKSYLQSKTMWSALAMALLPLLPDVRDFITHNPEVAGAIVGGIVALLRKFTKKPVVLVPEKTE